MIKNFTKDDLLEYASTAREVEQNRIINILRKNAKYSDSLIINNFVDDCIENILGNDDDR